MPSQSLTLATLLDPDGSLANLSVTEDALANESITSRTINVASVTTDFISEGFANLYYTDERARLAISVQGAGSYDNANGIITIGGNNLNTSNVSEGANLYFTNARARAAISAFDNTIIYNEATGAISANAAALGGFGGGPNVISVNGQVGVVTLQTDDISEATNLFFTEQRARDALLPDQTLLYDSSNGWLSIGQNVRPDSNVVFVEANVITLTIEDPEYLGNGSITFSNNTNAFVFSNTIIPVSDNVYDLGAPDLIWNNLYTHTINANIINASNTVIADTFVGNFQGNFVKIITVSSDLNSLVIDQESNPSLFLPKGSNVVFDLSNPLLNGIGFELGYDTNPLGNSEDVLGVTYVVNGIVTTRADYTSSFNASNTRLLYFNIPQSTGNSLVYYSPEYPTWKAPLVVAPPVNSDEVVEGDTNLYFSTERVQQVLSTVADGNVGVIYDENLNILTLSQDITPNADIEFRTVTANIAFYGDIYGNVYGNIFGQIANLNNFTTDDIAEGNVNAYFTNLRVRQSLNAGYGIEYSPILGQFSLPISNTVNANVYGGVSVIPVINVDNRGRIVNVSNVIPDYSNVTTNVAPNVNGTLNLGTSTRRWKDIYLSGNSIYLGNTIIREPSDGNIALLNAANQPADLVANTGALVESGINIFFSNARAIAAVSSLPITNVTAQVITTGNTIINDNSITTVTITGNLVGNVTGYVSNIDNFSTTNLKEGANLYFTNTRARGALSQNSGQANYNDSTGVITIPTTTSHIAEGANLYFTNNRVWSNVGANIGLIWDTLDNITTGTGANAISTSNVAEGANLYFTNARVLAALTNTTSNQANISVKGIEVKDRIFLSSSTGAIEFDPNGMNDYANIKLVDNAGVARLTFYVGDNSVDGIDFRVPSSNNGVQINDYQVWHAGNDGSGSGLDADLLDGLDSASFLQTGTTTTSIGEGTNLYFTNERVWANVGPNIGSLWSTITGITTGSGAGAITTSNVAEGANLYFTNSRARTALSGGTGVDYNPSTGAISLYQNVSTHSDVTFANVTVTGNLSVQGNALLFESNSLLISDPLFQIGKNPIEGDAVDLGFFAHYKDTGDIERHAGLFRDATDGQFKLFANLDPEPVNTVDISNISYDKANLVVEYLVGKVTDISNHTTTDLAEGANLYFTNARARAAISVLGTGSYDEANGIINIVGGVESVNSLTGNVVLTTANIAEDSNLYFTNARSVAALGGQLVGVSNAVSFANVTANIFYGNVGGGANNQLLYQTATDVTGFIAAPNVNYTFLRYDSANGIVWSELPGANTISYLANSIALDPSYGTYNSGNILSIQTVGDYNLDANNYYSINETATTPGYIAYIDFSNVQTFNRIVINLFYTQNSGHVIYVDLWNITTLAWDSFGTYNGLGSYYQFALAVLNPDKYIEANGLVEMRLYHASPGNTGHNHRIDYVALEYSSQGPQGPKGTTGSTGATGAGVATGGTEGQILYKANSTNYATYWGNLITSNVAEGANLYFTNTRVQSYLSNVAGNIIPATDNYYDLGSATNWWKSLYLSGSTIYFREGGNLSVAGNVLTFFDGTGSAVFSSGANVTTLGNLLVTGKTTLGDNTEINAATLTVKDGLIKLANANPDDLTDIGFYGTYIEESASKYTGLFRDATYGIYKFFKDLTLEPNVLVNTANATFTLADVEANQFIGTITSLSNHNTSNLTEGTNLYFTNARAREALTVTGTGSNYDNTTGNIYIVAGVANVNGQNGNVLLYTSNIAEYITEVNNLYFNNARARAAISNSGAVIDYDPVTGVISANVVAIGFNPDPVWANITAGITTDFVPEANNKYFTNAKVLAAVAGPDSNLANAIFNRVTVYAGNEAGLQWATTATNSFANAIITTNGFSTNLDIRVGSDPLDKIRFFAPGNYNLVYNDYEIWHANSNVTTSNIAEGSNLYYTNERVWANIGANVSYLLDTIGNITTGTGANAITTSNVAEGSNLYFTNDRVWANVGANIGNINAWLFSHNTTSGITEGSRLYFTNARARAAVGSSDTDTLIYYEANGNFQVNVSTIGTVTSVNGQNGTVVLTTSNVSEGSNQYFTNNRVYSALLNATSNATPIGVEKVYLKYGVDNGIIFRSNNAIDYANITANVFGGATYLTFHVGDNNSDQFKFYAPSSNLGLQFNDYRVWHEGNHGSGSGLDADLLDGIQATGFLQTGTTTTSISEGTNLYFSNARARAAVGAVGSNLVYYEGNGNFQVIVSSGGGGAVDSVNGQTGTVVLTTANVTEDTNLYFTNARARAAVSGGTGVSYNESTGSFSIGQAVGQTNDVTFANLIVTGNLTVQGNAIQFESNTLIINDPLIQIGKNPSSGDTVDLGFFGHYIQTGDVERHAGLFRDATDGNFKLFTNLDPEPVTIVDTANASFSYANLFVNNLYGTVFGSVNTISNFSTTDLAEGANLYFNNTRARAAVGAVGSNLVYYEANGNFQVIVSSGGGGGGAVDSVNGQTGTVVLTTANIAEVSNLYYTDDRVWANVGTNIGNLNSWVSSNSSNIGNINSWIGNNIDQPVKTTSSVTFANVSITDYVNLSTKGLRFPADAFGGSGDTATIILTASSGEATRMTFTMTNDADDVFEFITPSNNGLLMNGNVVWHSGNDGLGSGLDADLLDGQSGSYYLSTSNMTEGTNQFYTNTKVQGFLNSGADIVFGNANIRGTLELTGAVIDKANIVAAATGASFTASLWSDTLLYFTGTQAQNATINMTGLGVGANVGDAVTFTVFITNGVTPYYISTYQVDGTAVGVTTRWSGGGPYLGTASNIDAYQITVFKTAATPTYTIFVSASGFG